MNNYSLAVFLVNPNVRCVTVAYDKSVDHKTGKTIPSEIKSFKTLDATLAKDDFVVIPTDTRWGYTVGKIVDVGVRVNFGSNEIMRWVVARVAKDEYEDFCKQEVQITERVADAEEAAMREDLKNKLSAMGPNFAGLSLVDLGTKAEPRSGEPVPHGGAQGVTAQAPGTYVPAPPRSVFDNDF